MKCDFLQCDTPPSLHFYLGLCTRPHTYIYKLCLYNAWKHTKKKTFYKVCLHLLWAYIFNSFSFLPHYCICEMTLIFMFSEYIYTYTHQSKQYISISRNENFFKLRLEKIFMRFNIMYGFSFFVSFCLFYFLIYGFFSSLFIIKNWMMFVFQGEKTK